jgi:hypothetical protein
MHAKPNRRAPSIASRSAATGYKLIDAGWLSESDCERRDLIERALSLAIETLEFPRRKS